jgi:hypothetical protein
LIKKSSAWQPTKLLISVGDAPVDSRMKEIDDYNKRFANTGGNNNNPA